jgi:hypothetical protein
MLADNLSLNLERCVMARLIIDYVALDIDAGIDPEGIAVLTFVTEGDPSASNYHEPYSIPLALE